MDGGFFILRIYRANEVDKERFYQVPKSLFKNELYKGLSLESKMVYALLRDRMELSLKNGWLNDNGEIFLLYTRENLAIMLECSEPTARKAMKQLTEYKLIVEKRQGQGKPNLIYVCHTEKLLEDIIRPKEISVQDRNNITTSDTELSETENNYNNNGLRFSKTSTIDIFNKEVNKEVHETIGYYLCKYKQEKRKEHPRLKPVQLKTVIEQIEYAMSEYALDYGNMVDMIDHHFTRRIKTDYNINHFATEGILTNLMYDVAY
jgi:hypothetical protein